MAFNDTIGQLTGNSTFYDWFTKENSEIIAKLNQLGVSGVTGADGILSSTNTTTGLVTLSIGGTSGTIQAGLTFAGPIVFTGEIVVPNTSYKITGITSGTSGYTFGSVVRINSSGYTAANANTADSAEVIGVLSARNASYSVVTVLGKIDGDFFEVAGSTLSPGCVYFLSGTTNGFITTTEPTTMGYVSKPVIVGLGATSGVVVQYRGNYLNSAGAGGGVSGSNKLFVTVTKSPTDPSSYGFSAGNFISFAPDILSGNTFFHQVLTQTGRTSIDGWFLSGSRGFLNDVTITGADASSFTWEEDLIVGMIETVDTTDPSYNLYQLITHGTTTVLPKSISEATTKRGVWAISGSTYEVAATGITQQLVHHPLVNNEVYGSIHQAGFVFDSSPTYWYVNLKPFISSSVTASLRSTSAPENLTNGLNFAYNGDFSVWQRDDGKAAQYTSTGSIYFADSWIRRHAGVPVGSSQYLQKQSFSVISTEVEGTPESYIDVKCIADPGGADPAGSTCSVGHVIENIETFNGGSITVSFYAKCSQSSYSGEVYFARFSGGSRISTDTIGTVNFSTTWSKHTLAFDVQELGAGTYTDDYVEIGVDLMPLVEAAYDASVAVGASLFVSLASFVVYNGTFASPPHNFETYESKLKKSQKFYYSSYVNTQTIGSQTMTSYTEPVLNCLSFAYLPTAPFTIRKFDNQMREDPSIVIYSPQGVANEMYNYTASRDLKNTSGTRGYSEALRSSGTPGTATVSTSADATAVRININKGAVPYDVLNFHMIADASYPI